MQHHSVNCTMRVGRIKHHPMTSHLFAFSSPKWLLKHAFQPYNWQIKNKTYDQSATFFSGRISQSAGLTLQCISHGTPLSREQRSGRNAFSYWKATTFFSLVFRLNTEFVCGRSVKVCRWDWFEYPIYAYKTFLFPDQWNTLEVVRKMGQKKRRLFW